MAGSVYLVLMLGLFVISFQKSDAETFGSKNNNNESKAVTSNPFTNIQQQQKLDRVKRAEGGGSSNRVTDEHAKAVINQILDKERANKAYVKQIDRQSGATAHAVTRRNYVYNERKAELQARLREKVKINNKNNNSDDSSNSSDNKE